jgi:hypothetical protein
LGNGYLVLLVPLIAKLRPQLLDRRLGTTELIESGLVLSLGSIQLPHEPHLGPCVSVVDVNNCLCCEAVELDQGIRRFTP